MKSFYFLLLSIVLWACAAAPSATGPTSEVSEKVVVMSRADQPSARQGGQATNQAEAPPDALEAVEAWFEMALDRPELFPENADNHGPEMSAYRLVRLYREGPDHFIALFALDGEPPRTAALRVDLRRDEGGEWQVVESRWDNPRALWPRI